jgi:hypothetical protein
MDFESVEDHSDKFEFKANIDQMGNDSYHHPGKSIYEMMEIAIADPNCVCFNTLGYFKHKIENLTSSPYFGPKDGLFIKKDIPKKRADVTRVKMLCDWKLTANLIKEWSLMPVPQNIELTASDDSDFHVIINKPGTHSFDPSKTIYCKMEPTVFDETKNWVTKTWPKLDESKFYRIQDHRYLNGVQWNFPVPDSFPEKTNDVACILSNKNYDTGHKLRIAFVKANQDLVKVYGKKKFTNLESYQGIVPGENRANIYSKVKYCLGCENNAEVNYATEKIWEPILNEVLTFYWGCPNLEDYIDSRAFVRLPLEDLDEARKIIDQAIAEDWWSQRIDVIREEKKKILNIYGFFPNLQRSITRTKAVIITLKEFDRSDMFNKTLKDLHKLGIDAEVFYGVYGKNITKEEDKLTYENETYTYNPKERLNGQPMTNGEFGCAWSHVSVYKKLRDDPKYNNYLVLEDDAELCDLYALNNAIIDLPKDYDICHIGESVWYPFNTVSAVNNTYFNVEKDSSMGLWLISFQRPVRIN